MVPEPVSDWSNSESELWPTIHRRLIDAIAEQLQWPLALNFLVEVCDRHYYGTDTGPMRGRHERRRVDGIEERFVAIRPSPIADRDIVLSKTQLWGEALTIIELCSPATKTRFRDQRLQLRSQLIAQGINLVEVDLVRSGERWVNVEKDRETDCCAFISRTTEPDVEIITWRRDQPFPPIPIPINPQIQEVVFDLQAAISALDDSRVSDVFSPNGA